MIKGYPIIKKALKKKKMYKLFIVSLSLLLSTIAYSQEFSLFEAQNYALDNAEKFKREKLEVDIAQKQIIETRAMGLPQLNSSANFQNFLNLPVQVIDGAFFGQPGELVDFEAGTEYTSSVGLTVNQLIFDGSYIIGLQVSKFYKEFTADNLKKTSQEILYDVTRAYELALVSKQNKYFLDSLVENTEKLYDKQKALFETGMITAEDVDQINYALLQAKTNLSTASYSYQNAVAMLKTIMAYPLEDDIILTDNLSKIMEDATAPSTTLGEIENNLDLHLLKQQKQLREYDLKNTKMANVPRLGAFFNHQYNYFSNDFDIFNTGNRWFYQTVYGLQLNIPIFSSGERWAKTQQAKIKVKQNEYAIQELERSLKMQEIQFRNDFHAAKEKLEMQEENVILAKKIYENSLLKSEIGKENSIIVTQKYNQLVTAQSQYVNAMIEVFTAKLNLDQLYNKLNRN